MSRLVLGLAAVPEKRYVVDQGGGAQERPSAFFYGNIEWEYSTANMELPFGLQLLHGPVHLNVCLVALLPTGCTSGIIFAVMQLPLCVQTCLVTNKQCDRCSDAW